MCCLHSFIVWNFRLIEEELSARRSISGISEKGQEEPSAKANETLKNRASAESLTNENNELSQESEKYLKDTPVQKITESCVDSAR